MLRPDFTVADVGELSTLHVAGIVDGANVWVVNPGVYYTLEKTFAGLPPAAPASIAPLGGSPIAGAPSAIWFRNGSIGKGIEQSIFGSLQSDVLSATPGVFVPLVTIPITTGGGQVDIDAQASLSDDTADAAILVRLSLDGTPIPLPIGIAPAAATPTTQSGSIQARINPVPGPHVITLEFAPVIATNARCNANSQGTTNGASATMRVTEYAL